MVSDYSIWVDNGNKKWQCGWLAHNWILKKRLPRSNRFRERIRTGSSVLALNNQKLSIRPVMVFDIGISDIDWFRSTNLQFNVNRLISFCFVAFISDAIRHCQWVWNLRTANRVQNTPPQYNIYLCKCTTFKFITRHIIHCWRCVKTCVFHGRKEEKEERKIQIKPTREYKMPISLGVFSFFHFCVESLEYKKRQLSANTITKNEWNEYVWKYILYPWWLHVNILSYI